MGSVRETLEIRMVSACQFALGTRAIVSTLRDQLSSDEAPAQVVIEYTYCDSSDQIWDEFTFAVMGFSSDRDDAYELAKEAADVISQLQFVAGSGISDTTQLSLPEFVDTQSETFLAASEVQVSVRK